jgi:hypothetical protein
MKTSPRGDIFMIFIEIQSELHSSGWVVHSSHFPVTAFHYMGRPLTRAQERWRGTRIYVTVTADVVKVDLPVIVTYNCFRWLEAEVESTDDMNMTVERAKGRLVISLYL